MCMRRYNIDIEWGKILGRGEGLMDQLMISRTLEIPEHNVWGHQVIVTYVLVHGHNDAPG